MKRLAAIALLALAVTACSEGVDWSNYAPDVQRRIDRMAQAGDCAGLQDEFDNADANGGADLMGYIDDKLDDAGCYG